MDYQTAMTSSKVTELIRVSDDGESDSNSDGAVDLSDGIFTLGYLFLGSDDPGCQAAADANGDGSVNISDPTYTLVFLFGGGAAHPEPSACGRSSSDGDMAQGCVTPSCN